VTLKHFHHTIDATHREDYTAYTSKVNENSITQPGEYIRAHFDAFCEKFEYETGKPVSAVSRGNLLEVCLYDAFVHFGVSPETIRKDVLLGGYRAKADFIIDRGSAGVVGVFSLVSLRERWMIVDRNANILTDVKGNRDRTWVRTAGLNDNKAPIAWGVFLTERPGDSPQRCLNLAAEVSHDLYASNTRIISLYDEYGVGKMFESFGVVLPR